MPNHIYNRVTIGGDAALRNSILMDVMDPELGPGSMDFNRLLPMPASLDITDGTATDMGERLYMVYADRLSELEDPDEETRSLIRKELTGGDPDREKYFELGEKAYSNRLKYGQRSWYGWCIENWGTKWNAYMLSDDVPTDGSIHFYTAWAAPRPVIEEMSRRYPSAVIRLEWADEDVGYNLGKAVYIGGEMVSQEIPEPGSRKAYEMFSDITGESLEDLGYIFDEPAGTYRIYDDIDVSIEQDQAARGEMEV